MGPGPGLRGVRDHTGTVFWSRSQSGSVQALQHRAGPPSQHLVSEPPGTRDVFGTRHPRRGGCHGGVPLLGSRGSVERGPRPFPIASSEDPALGQTAVTCSCQTHVPVPVQVAWVHIRPRPMLIG